MATPRLPRLPSKVLALLAAGAASAAIGAAFVGENEGLRLRAYPDAGGVWTICRGHTRGVVPGMTKTAEECERIFIEEYEYFDREVGKLVEVPMSPARRAAVVSLCYNIGIGACARSSFIRRLNAGDPKACEAILQWRYVGSVDCSAPGNTSCPGVWKRRQQEYQLCQM